MTERTEQMPPPPSQALDVRRVDEEVGPLQDILAHLELMTKAHMVLLRKELKADAEVVGKNAAILAACGVLALIGYVMLNATIVLAVGVLASPLAAMWTAIGLTVLHLAVAGGAAYKAITAIKERDLGPEKTQRELEKDGKWIKQLTTS